MTDTESFLFFWEKNEVVNDPAKQLFLSYRKLAIEVEDARKKALEYIRPIYGSKGLQVGFDPKKIDEVSVLASRIDQAEARMESIAQGIKRFMEIRPAGVRCERYFSNASTVNL